MYLIMFTSIIEKSFSSDKCRHYCLVIYIKYIIVNIKFGCRFLNLETNLETLDHYDLRVKLLTQEYPNVRRTKKTERYKNSNIIGIFPL